MTTICVAGALSIVGTHSAFGSSSYSLNQLACQTNSGLTAEQSTPAGPAIMELRRLSGMKWEQLASLFEVTRRTVHFWASGKALNSINEEKLYRILSTVRQVDRGSAQENRDALFTAQAGGIAPIDLIRAGQYSEVVRLLGETSTKRPPLTPLSNEARGLRAPLKPEVLANALQDKISSGTARTRVVRAARIRNQKQFDDT